MFEGLVRQLILGYLGRYIKDIQRDQLRITLWNEEVLLENVELILEAFDYLQLPFALKQGRVGRLSIKIPWKKLGWDPIIITLEDVFICACQRDDQEWSMDEVVKREFAGKKAKLAAAELAKLSRRVCGNHAGQSFISYITAKIIDGIQVSMRNFHVLYCDRLADTAHTVFGLSFASLTITKPNLVGLPNIKLKGGQVSKLVEIQGLQIFCCTFHGVLDLMNVDIAGLSKLWDDERSEGDPLIHLLAPLDVTLSLSVKRPEKIGNDTPQYSMSVESTHLIISLDEAQLQQILTLWDYLCTCPLREKYGRYRPWSNPPSRKLKGWQTTWWHYAQQSVLSDVRKRLKKTSWKYLGERLNFRRKYVKLYKNKLERLQQEQLVGDDIIRELEQMEKESDIDDILTYRSAAEHELQECVVNPPLNIRVVGASAVERSQNDEFSSSRSRGWLNWLSLGMLGAGGTEESSQFSGLVSDEVIQDIYEATKFHHVPSFNGDASVDDEIYISAIKFSVNNATATLRNVKSGLAFAELIFKGILVECKFWDESAVVIASVNAVKMINPCNEQVNLLTGRPFFEEDEVGNEHPSLSIQVDVSRVNQNIQLSPKVILQPLEITYDPEVLWNVMELYTLVDSFKFQHERVLSSLSAIEDVKARLLSKAEFILSSCRRVIWDVHVNKVIINIPWEDGNVEVHKMMLECGNLSFASRYEVGDGEYQSTVLKNIIGPASTTKIFSRFQLKGLYDHFEIKLNNVEMKMKKHLFPQTISVLEKFCASISLAPCIIPDETVLKQLEVNILVSSLHANFSPSIHKAIQGLIAKLNVLPSKSSSVILPAFVSDNIMTSRAKTPKDLSFSLVMNLGALNVYVDLENDKENSCSVIVALQRVDLKYDDVSLFVLVKL